MTEKTTNEARLPAGAAPGSADWFWGGLGLLRDSWSPERHPFNRRWLEGGLSQEALRSATSEFDHVVLAMADVCERAAAADSGTGSGRELRRIAAEERDTVALWRRFARSTGWSGGTAHYYAADPSQATLECVSTCVGIEQRPLALDLVTLYAVELDRPLVNRIRLESLKQAYGVEDGPATDYFRLYAERGTEEVAAIQTALDPLLETADAFALLRHAEAVLRSRWRLLDACEEYAANS